MTINSNKKHETNIKDFPIACRLLPLYLRWKQLQPVEQKAVISLHFHPWKIFWTAFTCSSPHSVFKNFQRLESDIFLISNVSQSWSSKVEPRLKSRLLNLEWKSTELNRPTTSFELGYCNWARSTESLEINGLRKVILLEFVKVRGVLIGSNRSLRENDATCNCGPAAFCKDLLKTK